MVTNMDTLIRYALQDPQFSSPEEELDFYRNTRPIMRDEILTLYQFLEQKGLLSEFYLFRG